MTHADESEQISASLRKVLNAHGHGFHYAVMRRSEELFRERRSAWRLGVTEFPVVGGGDTTHIDFILQNNLGLGPLYLVAECKRADPAKARWCFAQAPYTRRNPGAAEILFDQFLCRPTKVVSQSLCVGQPSRGVYHLGLELKTGVPGDGVGHNKPAIDQAVIQVLRGTSGLINHLIANTSFSNDQIVRFAPVVFTTAQLWVTDVDLGSADLTTGNLEQEAVVAKKADWVWFNYNRSPALRHSLDASPPGDDLSSELRREFTRSVAIVSPDGIDSFLTAQLESQLHY